MGRGGGDSRGGPAVASGYARASFRKDFAFAPLGTNGDGGVASIALDGVELVIRARLPAQ
ncbi:MAG: hypothetical protein AB1938_04055 [Myxococcota bacterium]